MGDGDTCRCKDTRFINVLVIMEVPENGHVGIRTSLSEKGIRIKSPGEVHLHQHTLGLIQRFWEALVETFVEEFTEPFSVIYQQS